MKVEELRIGNYISTGIKEWIISVVSSNNEVRITDSKFNAMAQVPTKDIYPIPLTEEWLLKFGFDLINNEYHQSRNHELKLYWTVNKNKMIPEFNEKRFVTGYDFKYVHQLQNLYFILTGEELTIKNK